MSRPGKAAATAFCLAIALVAVGDPASAQGVPVVDSGAISEAVDNLKAATQEVQQLTTMLTQIQAMSRTIGQGGAPTWLLQQAGSGSGSVGSPLSDIIASAQQTANAAQTSYNSGQQVAGAVQTLLSQVDQLKGQLSSNAGQADFTTFSSTRAWVQSALTVPTNPSLTTTATVRTARSLIAAQAVADGYALALYARQQAPQLAARTQNLAQQVAQATDLRSDVQANTAVALAMHDDMVLIQQLMASLLKLEGASRLANTDPASGTGATTNGSH